ncbi:cytochrome b [Novosphingobium sp. SL115]|uniref:cytochrome b n=1 Tax=Novosphingobium sp. SL115 TaxID=2995150 RepID=UPI0022730539|nr:cytochrome b [Novosphingobium sp. SL115]MCY1672007.1 cytochrome b [Novosphingobium sp. SL115]
MTNLAGSAEVVRYNSVARTFHAVLAVMILFNLASGIGGEAIEDMWNPFPVHKATGILILLLSLARLGWRFTWTMPDWPATMSSLQRLVAKLTHGILYALMLAVPVTGWIMSSAGKYPISIYGLFEWPKLAVTKGSALAEIAHESHEVLGFLMAGLVILHIAAALHHHFVIKDNVLRRMF